MNRKLLLISLLPVTALLLMAATGTLYKGKFVDGGYVPAFIGNGGGLTNIENGSITNTWAILGPTSQQTNYNVTVYPNGFKYVIFSANTNCQITFVGAPGAGTLAGSGASVFINAVSSSVPCVVTTVASSLLTNVNLNPYVTNGFGQWFNFEFTDASTTNVTVIAGGLHRR